MKKFLRCALDATILLLIILLSNAAVAADISLEEIRTQLLNQKVVVLGRNYGSSGLLANSLAEWRIAKADADGNNLKFNLQSEHAPIELRGKRGTVISVQEKIVDSRKSRVGDLDAFGKPISEASILNPYLDVIVKLDDVEVYLGTTSYFDALTKRSMRLASRADKVKAEIEMTLQTFLGKTIYAVARTEALRPGISAEDLTDTLTRRRAVDRNISNLTPLTVLETKYLEPESAVLMKIRLPSGDERILFGDLRFYDSPRSYIPTPLQQIGIAAIESIPKKLTSREIDAVKNGTIFRGMTEDALYLSWGYPEKRNDWGRGGTQHIFPGQQYVYTEGGQIKDWQSMGR